MSADTISLWASARLAELIDDKAARDGVPSYGTEAWQRLPGNDPRRAAAIIGAAEMWRKYGDEEALLTWFRESSAPHRPIAERKTIAELNALAKGRQTRPVQATQGWPPVAIPGQPGWYRHLVDGRQVDVQRTEPA